MVSSVAQLRVVALWYALLGAICTVGAIVVFNIFWNHPRLWHELASPGSSLSIYISTAVAFWVSTALSLRYFVLSHAGQIVTLVVSILLALCSILAAGRVTVTSPMGLGLMAWWGLALACSLCSLLLWRNGRASNNRWRGP